MPASSSSATISRQWHLLKLIPHHRQGITAAVLLKRVQDAGFDASKRTIERDLVELDANFEIECDQSSKPYRWRWPADCHPEFLGLTTAEAVGLVMVEAHLRATLPADLLALLRPRFRKARELLDSLPGTKPAVWPKLFAHVSPVLPTLPPVIAEGVLATMQQALMEGRRVRASYRSARDGTPVERELHPLGLVQSFPSLYLVATQGKHAEPVLFALHRFACAEMTEDKAIRPRDFVLETYLESGALQFGGGKLITLEAEISDHLARLMEESPLEKDQILSVRKGRHFVKAVVRDSWRLQFWILSQGPAITVKKPIALRRLIQESLADALAGYEES
jgi:predicted DNA-binding transcriptional regulator YafY